MESSQIEQIVERQRAFFAAHTPHSVDYRVQALSRLYRAVSNHRADIADALRADLGKSVDESYMCETGLVLSEIRCQLGHVRSWSRPRCKRTPLSNMPGVSYSVQEPYGQVLIMSPWNYPVLLTLSPLAGAIAAGNCCVVKPSAYSPASSAVLRQIIEEVFDPGHVACVEGGRAENSALLDQRWDYIFFTGSVAVGKLVMEKAAANLTPVTLELGGKSPAVVDASANVRAAARRIVWGKLLNLGQTCVAPDYVLVQRQVHDELLECIAAEITRQFGEDPLANCDYGKMINAKHFERVRGLIDGEKVVCGGRADADELRIEPTVLDGVDPGDAVMQEEVFGPVLPVLTFDDLDEAERFIVERDTPLALYLFTRDAAAKRRFLAHVPFGGGCVNDTIVHLATTGMGFGGMGASGMGQYHGKKSFETFSHEKCIVEKPATLDVPFRYQPYKPAYQAVLRFFVK